LEANDIKIEDVLSELKKRQGISGLVEKANRE
jgi:phosphoribosyl-ATP pyrophosphohydrolase